MDMGLYQTFRNQYTDLKGERIERIIKGIEEIGHGRFEVFPNYVLYVNHLDGEQYYIYPLGYSDMPYIRFGFDGESATCEEIGEYLLNKYYGKKDTWTINIEYDQSFTKSVAKSITKWLDDKEKLNMKRKYKHAIDKVIFNPPATIIMWRSGEKTVVKCGDDEAFDPEKGLAMAIAKHEMGNRGNYYNQIRDILEEQSEYHMTEWLAEHYKAFNNPIVRKHFGKKEEE